ncbi:hypothetical protein IW261DRAFT_1608181 [Armillaria novae-zelandiae]|uniref:Uncharacterized protein n=1 Tax=Armillaria novae-zelandiae TaxID=153914 RepID=A0AA39P9E9_9AGAR|nr:hypothetical protein IW261DRAFT_1608181 [Armillaria novae-zelandiae]
MFVVLSGELAWTLRNRAQSHVAVNFKCIFKYARSSEEVRKPQDHISPSGEPWHTLPPSVQSCLKRGLGASCAYPNPDAQDHSHPPSAATPAFNAPPLSIRRPPTNLNHTQYYDYNGAFTGASSF